MNTRTAAITELERRIGHVFADRELLERALTHASVGRGATKVGHNERLEFLGDRVLNLLVAEHLMEAWPKAPEGELSKLMARLVDYQTCARVARAIGLGDALRVDASATRVGARDNDRVLGDACEALIAALYRDAGIGETRRFVLAFWAAAFEDLHQVPPKDPKTALQEWAMARALPFPEYRVVHTEGQAHAPVFTVEVRLPGIEPRTGVAGSKREAEKLAAETLLAHLATAPGDIAK